MASTRLWTGAVAALVAVLVLLGAAPSALAGWTQATALSSAVAPNTSPAGFAFDNGYAGVYFEAAADNQLHDLGWSPSAGWQTSPALTTTGIAVGSTPSGFDLGGARTGPTTRPRATARSARSTTTRGSASTPPAR